MGESESTRGPVADGYNGPGAKRGEQGGFASIRAVPGPLGISPDDILVVRARGDGRSSLLNLSVPTRRTASPFRAPMPTTRDEWTEARVPIREFVAQSFDEVVEGAGPVDAAQVNAIGITLGDGQPGEFALEVATIGLEPSKDEPSRRARRPGQREQEAPSPAT